VTDRLSVLPPSPPFAFAIMSSAHRETVPDPEQGTLDLVLPSDLPNNYSARTLVSGSMSPKSSFTQDTAIESLPKLPTSIEPPAPFTPVDLEGAPIPEPDTPLPTAEEKAVTLVTEKAAATVPTAQPKPAAKPGPKWKRASRWIRFKIWYNTYRSVAGGTAQVSRAAELTRSCRKFFTFVLTLNVVGLILAISGKWTYPVHYPSAVILGNLWVAILVRNEVFGRFLYLIVNTLFAKACSSAGR
jgi:hypothetical protein